MRTLVDLKDEDVKALDELSKREKVSRASLIREAIEDLLKRRRSVNADDGFGLWKKYPDAPADGLAYQIKIRSEW